MKYCSRANHLRLILVLATCSFVTAQESQVGYGPYLKASGSFGLSLGYGPGVAFGGGLDHRFRKALLLSDVTFDTADKVDAKGSTIRAGAGLYLLKNKFGIGGGARCGKLVTNVYTKGSCRPFLGGVYDSRSVRFDASYYFSGTDSVNHLQGVRTISVFPFTKHMLFEIEMSLYSFHSSFGEKRHIGFVANPGIRYRF